MTGNEIIKQAKRESIKSVSQCRMGKWIFIDAEILARLIDAALEPHPEPVGTVRAAGEGVGQ